MKVTLGLKSNQFNVRSLFSHTDRCGWVSTVYFFLDLMHESFIGRQISILWKSLIQLKK
jgi:hypothetical protein